MRMMLLAAAAVVAVAIPAAPAAAEGSHGPGFHSGSRTQFVDHRSLGHDGRRDGRRHRRDGTDVFIGDWGYSDWTVYNDRAFRSDGYNDWWHDRPDRSFPRWVTSGRCDRQC